MAAASRGAATSRADCRAARRWGCALCALAAGVRISAAVRVPVAQAQPSSARTSILYIVAHDLRVDVRGEHFSTLAARGTVFDLAFTQAPVCAPSRGSFTSGRRPSVSGALTFTEHEPASMRNASTWSMLPLRFREEGYHTASVGPTSASLGGTWCPDCWSHDTPLDIRRNFSRTNVDGRIGSNAAARLRRWAEAGAEPFFLMVGFSGSHIPLKPSEECSLVTRGALERELRSPLVPSLMPPGAVSPLQMAMTSHTTKNLARFGAHERAAMRRTQGGFMLPTQALLEAGARAGFAQQALGDMALVRHAYVGAFCDLDRAIGLLVRTLDSTGLANRTAVVFHADHGMSVGEYGTFAKTKLLDVDTRVPLMIAPPLSPKHSAPDPWARARVHARAVVQLLDVAPTLCALAGIPCAGRASEPAMDGVSLVPLLRSNVPDDARAAEQRTAGGCGPWSVALSTQVRCLGQGAYMPTVCMHSPLSAVSAMGTSVRLASWRYTMWSSWSVKDAMPLAALSTNLTALPAASDLWWHEELYALRAARHELAGIARPWQPWGAWGLVDLATESAEPSMVAQQPALVLALRSLAVRSWARPDLPMHRLVADACAGDLGLALRAIEAGQGAHAAAQTRAAPHAAQAGPRAPPAALSPRIRHSWLIGNQ